MRCVEPPTRAPRPHTTHRLTVSQSHTINTCCASSPQPPPLLPRTDLEASPICNAVLRTPFPASQGGEAVAGSSLIIISKSTRVAVECRVGWAARSSRIELKFRMQHDHRRWISSSAAASPRRAVAPVDASWQADRHSPTNTATRQKGLARGHHS